MKADVPTTEPSKARVSGRRSKPDSITAASLSSTASEAATVTKAPSEAAAAGSSRPLVYDAERLQSRPVSSLRQSLSRPKDRGRSKAGGLLSKHRSVGGRIADREI